MSHRTGTDLINEARQRIREVTPQEAAAIHARKDDTVFLDVREPNEWNLGRIPRAVHVPRGILETTIEARIPCERSIVVYCAGGNRSALAADSLKQMGYDNVSSMKSGFRGWVEGGNDVEG